MYVGPKNQRLPIISEILLKTLKMSDFNVYLNSDINAYLAQLVEHILGKDEVDGSIPSEGSNDKSEDLTLFPQGAIAAEADRYDGIVRGRVPREAFVSSPLYTGEPTKYYRSIGGRPVG